jgi:hypothetical protein
MPNASLSDCWATNILINGKRLYPVGGVQPGSNLTPGGIILDFSAKPRKVRRIRAYMGNRRFSGVGVAPQYLVWAPINPNRYRLVTEGDSTTRGAAPNNSSALDNRTARLAEMLGCDDAWTFAVGGTGFINAGGGSTVISRAPSVIAASPDVLYIAPINNDVGNNGTYNTVTRKAAYKQYFGMIRGALPNCVIIAGGGYGTGSNNVSTAANSAYQVEQDMKAAVAEFADSKVIFMPTISDVAGPWIVGDGNIGTTSNTNHGNSDRMIGDGAGDTLHPNQRFLDYIQWREFYSIVSVLDKLQ